MRGIHGLLRRLLLVLLLSLVIRASGTSVRRVLLHIGIVRLVLRVLRCLLGIASWLLLLLLLLLVHLGLRLAGVLLKLVLAEERVRLRGVHSGAASGRGSGSGHPSNSSGLLGVDGGLAGDVGETEEVRDVGEGGDE